MGMTRRQAIEAASLIRIEQQDDDDSPVYWITIDKKTAHFIRKKGVGPIRFYWRESNRILMIETVTAEIRGGDDDL